jgi:hypothetical protein
LSAGARSCLSRACWRLSRVTRSLSRLSPKTLDEDAVADTVAAETSAAAVAALRGSWSCRQRNPNRANENNK